MSLSSLISFIFPHLLLILILANLENKKSQAKCTETFPCGSLGNMSFPFTKTTQPSCGLCLVDCDYNTAPRIKLTSEEDVWYETRGPRNSTTISVNVPWLNTRGCYGFNNLSVPNTGSISVTFSPNITLFKCFHIHPKLDELFPGYRKFNKCEGQLHFRIYYKYPDSRDQHTALLTTPPEGCVVINMPAVTPRPHANPGNLSGLLANDFSLEWHVSDGCYDCHNRGGKCLTDSQSRFYCSDRTDTNGRHGRHPGLILGIAGFCLIFVLLVLTFIVWRIRRWNPYIPSRIKFSDPFSRTDVEAGSVYPGIPVFSYAELEEATDSFDSSKELGDGGFGIVYYGKLQDGREVAVKRLYEHNCKRVEQFMNEIEILTSLRHPNLVSLYGCTSMRSRELLLVYEYVPNGTVADHLHGSKEDERLLTWSIRMKIAIETATALAYLHSSDIIHRDVKTSNILLDHHFCVKVADFGLSRLFPNDITHVSTAPQGTPGYVDPQYHECYQLTNKSDVYSFGVVLSELISSLPAVDMNRHSQEINLANLAIDRIQRSAFDELIDHSLGYDTDPEIKRMSISIAELAFRCLQVNRELRPTMDEVLEVLEGIKEGKEDFKDETTMSAYKGGEMSPSPASEDTVLLKNLKSPSSLSCH